MKSNLNAVNVTIQAEKRRFVIRFACLLTVKFSASTIVSIISLLLLMLAESEL